MNKKINPKIKALLSSACVDISNYLSTLSDLSQEKRSGIIKKYTAAIEGNFVSWMGAVSICARSVQGRYAASENLWIEMMDDHAGMLREFARAAHSEPDVQAYQAVAESVANIRQMVAHLSGLECLTLIATLENTSGVFIPRLEKMAKDLGSNNLRYTKIHGEADIDHANQFAWAITHELGLHKNGEEVVTKTIEMTIQFLKNIFV